MGVEALSLQHTDVGSPQDPGHHEDLDAARANIVRQVLSFARGVEGERAEVQLKHIVREIDDLVRETFPKTIEIRSQVPKELLPVKGDATQLHQVLMNLCVNARDAYGYQVLLANDGSEAVALYTERREKIRAVLTDMMMPHMNGTKTIRALREIFPEVKIICTSGLMTSGQATEAADLKVNAFLTKPFAFEALLRTLRDVLGTA